MAESEKKPSLPPPSSSPVTSIREGDAIISMPKPETHVEVELIPETHAEFVRRRFEEQKPTNNDNNEEDTMFPIPRVPSRLRRGKNDAYEPNIISIGPYHRGKARLQAMEKRKFQNISAIINSPGKLKQFIEKLESLEVQVRECYTVKFELMTSKEFVEMMLLDSYFIIQLLRTNDADNHEDVANLRDLTWIAPLMLYDLLILENQLPFFLIESVFEILKSSSNLISLAYRLYRRATHKIFYHIPNPDEDEVRPRPRPRPTHLLQLYHWFIISTQMKPEKPKSKWINFNCYRFLTTNVPRRLLKKSEEIMIPNATALHEAGIKFRKNKGRGILDVKFNGGVLEIPPLLIDDGTVSLFNNLIALEDCHADAYYFRGKPQFTAYFKFLDHIINTVSDVVLLQKNGIIAHTYGSEREVAQLFNKLTRGATINPTNYLSGLYKEVNEYSKKKRHIWGAIFLRRHCSNPLTILSTIGFLFLLALTFIQSYFAVYAYFRPPSQSPSWSHH